MKKLLITTMAAVSVGLCAKAADDGFISGTSFDDLTTGNFSFDNDYWPNPTNQDDEFKIIDVTYPEGVTKQHWDWTDGEKALSIDTANPILRNVNPIDDESGKNEALDVSTNPVFFDSVVQFTATDVAPVIDTLSNKENKLMVWLYTSPDDVSVENKGLFEETAVKKTLVITAGVIEKIGDTENLVQKNYDTGIEIEPESWHRLTIKSFLNKEKTKLMFNVWLDGAEDPITAEGVTDFLSLVTPNEDSDNYLQGVAFDGKGAVDDIVFTTTNPFAVATYTVSTTINDKDGAAYTKQYSVDGGASYTDFVANDSSPFVKDLLILQSVQNITFKFLVCPGYKVEGATKTTQTGDVEGEIWSYWEKQIAVSSISFTDNVGAITLNVVLAEEVTYPTVKPNGDSTTQETLSASAVAAIEEALVGVETMPAALTVIVNEKEYFGDEAVAKINEVVTMFKAAKEGETLKFFDASGIMKVSFKAKNPLMETETAEATDYEAMVGESAATVTSDYTVNKETVDLTPGVTGENEAVTFKLVIKPVSSTGSDTGSAEQE